VAAAERARIADELHGLIVWGIAVMTAQAVAGRAVLREDPDRARDTIASIEETGRETLAEMRHLLGILRADADRPRLPVGPP
jgi:Signal transduction histidine kinase